MPRSKPLPFASLRIDKLLEQLGDVPAHRVRFDPQPGRATERDLIRAQAEEDSLFELVDGTLVEKAMGFSESALALDLSLFLKLFLRKKNFGILTGPDGSIRLMKGLVRIPDLAFTSWERLPGGKLPTEPIPELAPDLAVEILSVSNTKREMERKLKEYFFVGVRLVWFVDPRTRAVSCYTSPDEVTHLTEEDTLAGGDVLPGFELPLRTLFAQAEGPSAKKKGKNGR